MYGGIKILEFADVPQMSPSCSQMSPSGQAFLKAYKMDFGAGRIISEYFLHQVPTYILAIKKTRGRSSF
jgi:hypothetical protein